MLEGARSECKTKATEVQRLEAELKVMRANLVLQIETEAGVIRELEGLLADLQQARLAQQLTVDEGADNSSTSAEHLAASAEEAARRKAILLSEHAKLSALLADKEAKVKAFAAHGP